MSLEQQGAKLLGEDIGDIQGCWYSLQLDKVLLDPLAKDVPLDVDVSCPTSRAPRVCHQSARIVVLISDGRCELRDSKVPHNTPRLEDYFTKGG